MSALPIFRGSFATAAGGRLKRSNKNLVAVKNIRAYICAIDILVPPAVRPEK